MGSRNAYFFYRKILRFRDGPEGVKFSQIALRPFWLVLLPPILLLDMAVLFHLDRTSKPAGYALFEVGCL